MNYTFDSPQAIFSTKFINSTNRHIFLTGKAGTGKTTLLKQLVETTHKKTVIAAPTGIAAINAGGVTLHSLFHLPFGTFVPSNSPDLSYRINTSINTPQSLIKGLKMNSQKRNLLNEIELLIIDEVSMLRADILDAIDYVLRHVRRRRNTPFGGVQILFIGDLWQLPPVVKNNEVDFLKQFYSNFYFFNALALRNTPPINIELKHIYRQTDQDFINILNHFRTNKITSADLQILNECHPPHYNRDNYPGYIYLTTHNNKADEINAQSLEQLPGSKRTYKASIQDDFNENLYPVDPHLVLKKDAQVMFIKNDYSGEQAYFNGKIGKVTELAMDYIRVKFDDGSKDAIVEQYTWENKKYRLNNKTGDIEENLIGKFTHYPLKLAWAITIHKSQGLTFKKAIVDISDAFASGQAYVALSRLTSLNGLILSSPVKNTGPETDVEVTTFTNNQKNENELSTELKISSTEYAQQEAIKTFEFGNIKYQLSEHIESYDKTEGRSAKQSHKDWAIELQKQFLPLMEVGSKFQKQLQQYSAQGSASVLNTILERVMAAKGFFEPKFQELSKNTLNHIAQLKAEKGVKKYLSELVSIESLFYNQIVKFRKTEGLLQAIINNAEFDKNSLKLITNKIERPKADEKIEKEAKAKGNTSNISFDLFKSGKTIEEVAKERNLTVTTIETHLAKYVATGELSLEGLVNKKKIKPIIEALKEFDSFKAGPIKFYLGDNFSYSEIRFVTAHFIYENMVKEK